MFYQFRQNNSGGSFDEPAINVIVEASSAVEANEIAQQHGIYFDGCDSGTDCSCCGDRWSPASEYDASERPQVYDAVLTEDIVKEPPEDAPFKRLYEGILWAKVIRKS